jgi:hypothetical protein
MRPRLFWHENKRQPLDWAMVFEVPSDLVREFVLFADDPRIAMPSYLGRDVPSETFLRAAIGTATVAQL